MKKLLIVESPHKASTIGKYLGNDYKVMSSKGHILSLSTTGKGGLGIDLENDFKTTYVIDKDKKEIVKSLKEESKKADITLLATDPDREGEAISYHLAKELKLDLNENNRIVFNEITPNAIKKALESPRAIDLNLVKSQETRRILDRIIGFKLSGLLKNKIKSKSAGRVQSVALRMICDREHEIENFKPEEYWIFKAEFKENNIRFIADLHKDNNKTVKIKNENAASKINDRIKNPFLVKEVKEETKYKTSKDPFITSTLQQEASSKLNFAPKKTMMIAQKLYEGINIGNETIGLISYMRTDSFRLADEFINEGYKYIKNTYGKEYVGSYKSKTKENAQDAHEAIRPTDILKTPESIKNYLKSDEFKLYSFIYYRTLACLMKKPSYKAITYILSTDNLDFKASGQSLIFDGYLKVYSKYENNKDVLLPVLKKGDLIDAVEIIKEQKFTEPPLRYSESKLIKALEEENVGRPSTYAGIIDTIISRSYVELIKDKAKTKYFHPTEQGILTDNSLKEYFKDIINIKYTAKMEADLDLISLNKVDYIKLLNDFYNDFKPLLDNAYAKMEKKAPELVGETCPECGGNLVYRFSRFGKFISCENYPSCKYLRSLKEKKQSPIISDQICPDCGKELIYRKSRYGKYFLGCSGFPKCRHIENLDNEMQKELEIKLKERSENEES